MAFHSTTQMKCELTSESNFLMRESPNLTPLYYWFWGMIGARVYHENKPKYLVGLRARIEHASARVTLEEVKHAVSHISYHPQLVIEERGDFFDIFCNAQFPSSRQPCVLLEPKLHEISEIGSFANKFGPSRDSPATQLNLSQAQSLGFRQQYVLIEPKLYKISEMHSFVNKFGVARDSPFVYNVLGFCATGVVKLLNTHFLAFWNSYFMFD
ncbi:hypothetical protein T265_00519 [Opisthorchis viverrini]|uniref:Uncharacterized protein n=1 Tax=Opisthorchis viverrini TaxID=6198 RepID=A0A075A1N2_OPIVI|nr:hypothetical protein T265_00519 [Opisthorchis viverrini]KER33628.1 hypothetical protein T265_00519 [Opisthorchis viverrini]